MLRMCGLQMVVAAAKECCILGSRFRRLRPSQLHQVVAVERHSGHSGFAPDPFVLNQLSLGRDGGHVGGSCTAVTLFIELATWRRFTAINQFSSVCTHSFAPKTIRKWHCLDLYKEKQTHSCLHKESARARERERAHARSPTEPGFLFTPTPLFERASCRSVFFGLPP